MERKRIWRMKEVEMSKCYKEEKMAIGHCSEGSESMIRT